MRHTILILIILFSLMGCTVTSQSVNVLFTNTISQIDNAQKAGAKNAEIQEARVLLAEAKNTPKNKDKKMLLEKAYAKSRLAEALARQAKAESEASRLEAEVKILEEEANRIRLERQSAENSLNQLKQGEE